MYQRFVTSSKKQTQPRQGQKPQKQQRQKQMQDVISSVPTRGCILQCKVVEAREFDALRHRPNRSMFSN